MKTTEKEIQNLGFELHNEVLKATEQFCKKNGNKVPFDAILTGLCAALAGMLANAPNKAHALRTLESCNQTMQQMIKATPASYFNAGAR